MRKFKMILCFSVCLTALVCIFGMGNVVTDGLKSGLLLCSSVIIPSLFPFMTVCSFMEKSGLLNIGAGKWEWVTGRLFKLPGCTFLVRLLSFFAGYPVGARMVRSMHSSGAISLSEGKKMCLFCIGAGPAFLVIAVGCGMLYNKWAGWILAVTHLLSAIVTALLCGRFVESYRPTEQVSIKKQRMSLADALVESVAASTGALISVCAYTVLFSGVVAVIKASWGQWVGLALTAVTEVSNGCALAAVLQAPIPVFAAITGFGGISVMCQVMACAGVCRPKFTTMIAVRCVNAAISYIICSLLLRIFPVSEQVFSTFSVSIPKLSGATVGFPIAFLVFCTVFLFSTYQKSHKRLVDFF